MNIGANSGASPKTFVKKYDSNSIFCIVGATKSGKTHFTKKLLKELDYDYLFVMCPTLKLNNDYAEEYGETSRKLWNDVDYPGIRTKHFDDQKEFNTLIKDIFDSQERLIKKDGKKNTPQILLLLDDCGSANVFHFNSFLSNMAISMRHYKIGAIVISQRLKAIGRTMRLNAAYFIIFSGNGMAEIEHFFEEYLLRKYKKNLFSILESIFSEPYNYILADNLNPVIKERLYKNGTELIKFL